MILRSKDLRGLRLFLSLIDKSEKQHIEKQKKLLSDNNIEYKYCENGSFLIDEHNSINFWVIEKQFSKNSCKFSKQLRKDALHFNLLQIGVIRWIVGKTIKN